jgi:hypothetical protein
LRRRVLLSGTMLVAAVAGYGRRAYGACLPSGGSTYQCSGANLTTQPITTNNASVSTVAGFSVNTPAGNAITITGNGALSYTDTNASPLTAATNAYLVAPAILRHARQRHHQHQWRARRQHLSGIRAPWAAGAITITANGKCHRRHWYRPTGGITAPSHVTTGAGTTVSAPAADYARRTGTGAYPPPTAMSPAPFPALRERTTSV